MRPAFAVLIVGYLILTIPPVRAQQHFTDCSDGEGNINNLTLVVWELSSPTLDGEPLAFGSEIAVFSAVNELCAGVAVWNGNTTVFAVWGDDNQTPEAEGMANNEPLSVRVWDAASRNVYADERVEIGWQDAAGLDDSGVYRNDAFVVIEELTITSVDPPDVPPLLAPANDAVVIPSPYLDWGPSAGATIYQLQVDNSPAFDSPYIDRNDINATESTIVDMPIDVTWYWRVRAINVGGESEWSQTRSFTTVDLPPAPELLWPTDGAEGVSVPTTLFWNDVEFADAYHLQIARSVGFVDMVVDRNDIMVPTVSTRELDYETTYFWRVRSISTGGDGPWSDARAFTTENQPPPPAPSLLDPPNGAEDVIVPPTLTWSETERGTSYRVQLADEFEFIGLLLDETVQTTDIRLDEISLAPGKRYWWRVQAIGAAGAGDWSALNTFVTRPEPIPSPPALIDPLDGAEDLEMNPNLLWSASTGATGYRVQISDEPGFSSVVLNEASVATEFSVDEGILQPGTTYWWRVRAASGAGAGDWSEAFEFATADITGLTEPADQPGEFPALTVYPNPVVSSTVLEFAIDGATHVQLRIFDLLGREIETLVSGSVAAGTHRVEWQPRELTNGIYIAHLQIPETTIVRTISVAR